MCSTGNVRLGSAIPTSLLRHRGGSGCCTSPVAVRSGGAPLPPSAGTATPCHTTREAQRNHSNHSGWMRPRPLQGRSRDPLPGTCCAKQWQCGDTASPRKLPLIETTVTSPSSPPALSPGAALDQQSPAKNPAATPQQGSSPVSPSPWDAATLEEPLRDGRSQAEGSGVPKSQGFGRTGVLLQKGPARPGFPAGTTAKSALYHHPRLRPGREPLGRGQRGVQPVKWRFTVPPSCSKRERPSPPPCCCLYASRGAAPCAGSAPPSWHQSTGSTGRAMPAGYSPHCTWGGAHM